MSKIQKIIDSTSPVKILIPAIIGLAVVLYMMFRSFNYTDFRAMSWDGWTIFFLATTAIILIIRHLAYSWRLRLMSDKFFSWKKSIELIFIWEFASAISPTSLGGSATAMLFLAQEKLSGAKTVTIVLYSVVLDTFYTIISLVLFLLILGPQIIRPDLDSIFVLNGYALSFWIIIALMLAYGSVFFYGLFINPRGLSKILQWISKWKLLHRFQENLQKTATDIIQVSQDLQQKTASFHIAAFISTSIAWLCRFATIPLIVFAVIHIVPGIKDFFLMLARNETMFAITAFSPTPGASGVTEVLFGGFFSDYISNSDSIVVAIIWRLMTYYSYLIAGSIILPIWIGTLLTKRKKNA